METAEPVFGSKHQNPIERESRKAMEISDQIANRLLKANNNAQQLRLRR